MPISSEAQCEYDNMVNETSQMPEGYEKKYWNRELLKLGILIVMQEILEGN
jgi:hypothetical protein